MKQVCLYYMSRMNRTGFGCSSSILVMLLPQKLVELHLFKHHRSSSPSPSPHSSGCDRDMLLSSAASLVSVALTFSQWLAVRGRTGIGTKNGHEG